MDVFQTGEQVTPTRGPGRCRRTLVWRFSESAPDAPKATRAAGAGRPVDCLGQEVASAVPKIQTELAAA